MSLSIRKFESGTLTRCELPDRDTSGIMAEREIIFEFLRVGAALKVSAIDAQSGVEASIVGDPKAGEETLRRLARQKLAYVMRRQG